MPPSPLARKMRLQRTDDRVDDLGMGAVAADDVDVRLGIEGLALGGETGECRTRVPGVEQRPGAAAGSSVGEYVDGRVEPDGDCPLVQQPPRVRVDIPAA